MSDHTAVWPFLPVYVCICFDHRDRHSAFYVWVSEFPSVWLKPCYLVSSRSVRYLCAWFISCQLIWSNCMRKEATEDNYWLIINRLIISFWNYEHVSSLHPSRQGLKASTFIQGRRPDLFLLFYYVNKSYVETQKENVKPSE